MIETMADRTAKFGDPAQDEIRNCMEEMLMLLRLLAQLRVRFAASPPRCGSLLEEFPDTWR